MDIRSPFPGMDPWLESHWRDVHNALITYARDTLNPQLPGGLRARTEERVFVEAPGDDDGESRYPDVRIVEYRTLPGVATAPAPGGRSSAGPVVVEVPAEDVVETYLQIIDTGSNNKLVSSIEFLSHANKRPGAGQEPFLAKQRQMRAGGVNVVEIDLLRRGQRVLMLRPAHMPPALRTTYQACVSHAARPTQFEIYPAPLREPLPVINVPLRDADPDATLDLQALVEQAYRNGRYDSIDYAADPSPPLPADHAAWADALLKQHAKR